MDDEGRSVTGHLPAKIQSQREQFAGANQLLDGHRQDPDGDLYRALFSATEEGLLVVNDEGRYVEVNDAYARLLGSTREAVVGRHFSEFMPPNRLAEAVAAFENLKAGGTQDTADSYALISHFPGLNGNGELLYFAGNKIPAVMGAVQAFTDPAFARTLVTKMKGGASMLPHYYQVVLKIRSMDETPIDISYVFHHDLETVKLPLSGGQ